MIHIKKIWNVYLTYNKFLKYGFREAITPWPSLKYAPVQNKYCGTSEVRRRKKSRKKCIHGIFETSVVSSRIGPRGLTWRNGSEDTWQVNDWRRQRIVRTRGENFTDHVTITRDGTEIEFAMHAFKFASETKIVPAVKGVRGVISSNRANFFRLFFLLLFNLFITDYYVSMHVRSPSRTGRKS
jgi:hypothetical protein